MELERIDPKFKLLVIFFPPHLEFTLLFSEWTKSSSLKLVLKSTCTEIDLSPYLLMVKPY